MIRFVSRRAARRIAAAMLAAGVALMPEPAAAQARPGTMACPALPARAIMPPQAVPQMLDDPNWRARSAELTRATARDLSRTGMVFLGDSITQGWLQLVWDQFYGHRNALNLGVTGDFTQGMLWRLTQGGQWPTSLRPKVAVLLIGTNNSLTAPPEDTALGVAEIVRLILRQSPATSVLIVGLLPRGPDVNDPARRANQKINELVARCADNQQVFYTDPGSMLVDGQGRLSEQVAFDRLHLTWIGYAMLSAGLEPSIRYLLGR